MVECEFLIWNNSQYMPDVLIDTWWNVNQQDIYKFPQGFGF